MPGQNGSGFVIHRVGCSLLKNNKTISDSGWLLEQHASGKDGHSGQHEQAIEDLTLMEKLELLSHARNKKTGFFSSGNLRRSLGGCILIELELRGRIGLTSNKSTLLNRCVVLKSADKTGEPLLDEILQELKTDKKQHTVRIWIAHISKYYDIRKKVKSALVAKGILATEKSDYIFFQRTKYRIIDNEEMYRVVEKIQNFMLSDVWKEDLDKLDSRLLSLVAMTCYSYMGVLTAIRASLGPDDSKEIQERLDILRNAIEAWKRQDNQLVWALIELFQALIREAEERRRRTSGNGYFG